MNSQSHDFDDLINTPAFIADPYPVMRRMREEDPVHWSNTIGGWVITGYDDILFTFRKTTHFSNENRLGKVLAYLPPEKRATFKPFEEHWATKSLLHSDPPDHTRMRTLVTQEFTAKVVEQIKPSIQQTVDRLIDAALPRGEMEIVSEFAGPVPINTIAAILGVPVEDRHYFQTWADALLAFQGSNKPSEADIARAQDSIVEMRPYIRGMIEERRRQPQNDLMSKFAAAEAVGGRITEPELISTCGTLFVAGQETTLSLISSTIYNLLAHPDQLALLREDPDLLASAIEESLRFESPVSRQPRIVKEDIQIRGKTLKKGDVMFQMLNAANRDPAYFANPDDFRIRREPNRHMAFGNGIHFCVGATLARAEALIAARTIFQRLPNLRLVDAKPDWDLEKRNSRVLKTLRVKF